MTRRQRKKALSLHGRLKAEFKLYCKGVVHCIPDLSSLAPLTATRLLASAASDRKSRVRRLIFRGKIAAAAQWPEYAAVMHELAARPPEVAVKTDPYLSAERAFVHGSAEEFTWKEMRYSHRTRAQHLVAQRIARICNQLRRGNAEVITLPDVARHFLPRIHASVRQRVFTALNRVNRDPAADDDHMLPSRERQRVQSKRARHRAELHVQLRNLLNEQWALEQYAFVLITEMCRGMPRSRVYHTGAA